jgi:hypothetical protein
MTTDEKHSAQEQTRGRSPGDRSADPKTETEAVVKGDAETAKREAERDWQNSSKESGD